MSKTAYTGDRSHVGTARCFFCLEADKILINRQLQQTLPRDCGVIDMEPCTKCKGYMQQGIILIGATGESLEAMEGERQEFLREESNFKFNTSRQAWDRKKPTRPFIPNPHRTGLWVVIKEEAVKKMFNPGPTMDFMLHHRWGFIDQEAADKVGLTAADKTAPQG